MLGCKAGRRLLEFKEGRTFPKAEYAEHVRICRECRSTPMPYIVLLAQLENRFGSLDAAEEHLQKLEGMGIDVFSQREV